MLRSWLLRLTAPVLTGALVLLGTCGPAATGARADAATPPPGPCPAASLCLFECPRFSCGELVLQPPCPVPDLRTLGWNDRARSMIDNGVAADVGTDVNMGGRVWTVGPTMDEPASGAYGAPQNQFAWDVYAMWAGRISSVRWTSLAVPTSGCLRQIGGDPMLRSGYLELFRDTDWRAPYRSPGTNTTPWVLDDDTWICQLTAKGSNDSVSSFINLSDEAVTFYSGSTAGSCAGDTVTFGPRTAVSDLRAMPLTSVGGARSFNDVVSGIHLHRPDGP